MVDRPDLIAPEIAATYEVSIHTVTKCWAQHLADLPQAGSVQGVQRAGHRRLRPRPRHPSGCRAGAAPPVHRALTGNGPPTSARPPLAYREVYWLQIANLRNGIGLSSEGRANLYRARTATTNAFDRLALAMAHPALVAVAGEGTWSAIELADIELGAVSLAGGSVTTWRPLSMLAESGAGTPTRPCATQPEPDPGSSANGTNCRHGLA